jgi:fimbrial chaperone protein
VRACLTVLCFLVAAAHSLAAQADGGFAALVSPPRFEVAAKPGTTLRQVFELTNRSAAPARFKVRTADFTLGADYSVIFHDELTPGSCRPWVAIERQLVALPGGGTIRYRFEVAVPADAPAGECRFGILIEGDEPSIAQSSALQLPVVGRIGIIVYVKVGNGAPKIEVFGPEVVTLNGAQVPALRVHNSGDVHARMSGFLTGTDAQGKKYDFTPSDLPILPGEERLVFLTPSTPEQEHPTLSFPVNVKGTLEWGDQSTELNESFK